MLVGWPLSNGCVSGEHPRAWMAVMSSMSGNIGQANMSDGVLIGHGLPTVPKSLLEKIRRWEFIDLAELMPPQSVHDQMIDTQAKFALFELIRPKRKQIESITEWTKAYTVYIAALLQNSRSRRASPAYNN